MKRGFTLLEIMIVIVIISILVLIFTSPFQSHIGDTETKVQQINSSLLESSIKQYKMDTDQFPFDKKITTEVSPESQKIIQSLLDQRGSGKNFDDIKDSFYTLDSKKLRNYTKGNTTDMQRYFSSDSLELEGLVFTYKTAQNKNKERFTGSYALVENKSCSNDPSTDSKIQLPKEGAGTGVDPFVVTTIGELQAMKLSPTSDFELGNDIESCVTKQWNNGLGFEPIPLFQGGFRQTNFSINNLFIDRPSEDNVGLFSKVSSPDTRSFYLSFKNPNITGKNFVGVLSGIHTKGTTIDIKIENGTVSGDNNVGGAFGSLNDLVFGISINGTTIKGNRNVGGLAGVTLMGAVNDSFVKGKIIGNENVGGAFGQTTQFSRLSFDYISSSISGSINVQPMVGKADAFTMVQDSFYNTNIISFPSSYGTGKTESEMKLQSTYVNWDFTDTWVIDPNINDGFPYLK
ncbi:prepilin-type N-terminal cleavage/methylation domain-containing protein [Bacillus luti]|uniref:prepilin-type N-terminal cleavage/methylation domain-containing protein n=1 Tax=Bacillus luti TaxID=2026191 RepID=UPI0012E89149|nr:prepilin-type N-terminal cleavage/methylation domain-containing protein [Bacillus luti]